MPVCQRLLLVLFFCQSWVNGFGLALKGMLPIELPSSLCRPRGCNSDVLAAALLDDLLLDTVGELNRQEQQAQLDVNQEYELVQLDRALAVLDAYREQLDSVDVPVSPLLPAPVGFSATASTQPMSQPLALRETLATGLAGHSLAGLPLAPMGQVARVTSAPPVRASMSKGSMPSTAMRPVPCQTPAPLHVIAPAVSTGASISAATAWRALTDEEAREIVDDVTEARDAFDRRRGAVVEAVETTKLATMYV